MKVKGVRTETVVVDVSKQDALNALAEYCYNKFNLDEFILPYDNNGFREFSVYPIRHPKYSKEQKAVVKLFKDLRKMLDV